MVINDPPLISHEHFDKAFGAPRFKAIETILYLEDNPQIHELTEAVLLALGAGDIFHTESGLTALNYFEEKKKSIDLVISDRKVPQIRGEIFVPLVKRLSPLTVILMTSGSLKFGNYHEDAYLSKPVSLDDLIPTLLGLDSLVAERKSWSQEQITDYLSQHYQNGNLDKELIKTSEWTEEMAMRYIDMFRQRGLDSILVNTRSLPIVSANKDYVIINLSTELHSPHILLAAAPYLSAHEKMHALQKQGKIHSNLYNLQSYHIQSSDGKITEGLVEAPGIVREIIADAAAIKCYGASIIDEGFYTLVRNDSNQNYFGSESLSLLVYRQAQSREFSKLVSGSLQARLEQLSSDYGEHALSILENEPASILQTYNHFVDTFCQVFQSVRIDGKN
ncbi:MAG: response regulator [Nanoarchaeota archaeon]